MEKKSKLDSPESGEQELVGHTSDERNWRGICIALLVIVLVCAVIVISIIVVTPGAEHKDIREKITRDNFLKSELQPNHFHATWLDEDAFLYRNNDGTVIMYNCTTNSSVLLMDNSTFRELDATQYKLSPDGKYALLPHSEQHIYRHSTLAKYSVYNLAEKTYKEYKGSYNDDLFQYVTWSPKGHDTLFVQHNNIFYRNDKETKQLTFDGIPGEIYNGIPDWVYEEEILGSDNAIWWSRDGTYILYAQFNDTAVRKFSYPFYGDSLNEYGEEKRIPYPKPGYANPTFKLKVVHIKTNTTVEVKPPPEFANVEHYFTTVSWRDDTYFLVTWVNRGQNISLFTVCTAINGDCKLNFKEEIHGGWIDVFKPAIFSSSGKEYFMVMPNRDAKAGYFKHVAMVKLPVSNNSQLSANDVGTRRFLTSGQWEVTDIVGINDELQEVYFIATPGDPRKRHLYSVSTANPSSTFTMTVTCLSCDIGVNCQYVQATFSKSGKFYILGCLGPDIPSYTLKSTINTDISITLEDNQVLRNKLKTIALPAYEYFEIGIKNGQKIYAKIYLPPALNKEEILTYPLLLTVYGSPGTQEVTEKFEIKWTTYLTSNKNIITAFIDFRGAGGRGDTFLHSVYQNLGVAEAEDVLTAAEFFSNLSYVDASKLSIWGWSYGGFVTATVLGRQPKGAFECGISVAPVTDWLYYDSVYTERYMKTPMENQNGYKLTSVLQNAKNFKNTMFMLIHGTGDDNVHFQNSAQLMRALVEEHVHFEQQFYTDQQHSLDGGRTKEHLYKSMEFFLDDCYQKNQKIMDQINAEEAREEAAEDLINPKYKKP